MLFSFDLVNEFFQNRATLRMLEFLCREPLTSVNMEIGFEYEEPQEQTDPRRSNRAKTHNKTLSEEEVRIEMAIQAKNQRTGYLGELRKQLNYVRELTGNSNVQSTEIDRSLMRYEEAFRKFVISHENYMRYEDHDEKRKLMTGSYDNQRDIKLQLDIMVNGWRVNYKGKERLPSESGFSMKSIKSDKSYASNRSSVKERKRAMEEARLKMETLRERQELERELEEVEKSKTELNRRIELLNAESEVKQAEIDFTIEQSVEEGEREME